MIAKAKAISHGVNGLRYITGESHNKKNPEKIYRVYDNILPSHLDAYGIWNSMQLTFGQFRSMKNSVIRIELSPSPGHTRHFTLDDWEKLWKEFIEEFDKQNIPDKNGKVISKLTNISGSKHTVWLHTESDGGIPHLHGIVCRVDENGNVNNDHKIHLRAQRAAERVARKRGWTTAIEVHNSYIPQVNTDCLDTLQSMPSWSWDDYKRGLQAKGYSIFERRDESGTLRGYVLQKGSYKYKASEIGVGRNLMASKLERTWKKLHHQPATSIRSTEKSAKVQSAPKIASRQEIAVDYTQYRPNTDAFEVTHNGEQQRYFVPRDVLNLFDDEFDYRLVANCDELKDLAVAIFVGLIGGDEIVATGGGGGSQSDLPWRDKNEDELDWARRCARMATRSLGKQTKSGLKR